MQAVLIASECKTCAEQLNTVSIYMLLLFSSCPALTVTALEEDPCVGVASTGKATDGKQLPSANMGQAVAQHGQFFKVSNQRTYVCWLADTAAVVSVGYAKLVVLPEIALCNHGCCGTKVCTEAAEVN